MVFGVQHRQRADHAMAQMASARSRPSRGLRNPIAVEALHEERRLRADPLDSRGWRLDTTAACERGHGGCDGSFIPPVPLEGELGHPEAILVLRLVFRACATECGTPLHEQ